MTFLSNNLVKLEPYAAGVRAVPYIVGDLSRARADRYGIAPTSQTNSPAWTFFTT